MLQNLLLGLTMMSFCLLLQGVLVVAALRYYIHQRRHRAQSGFLSAMRVTSGLMLILIAGNTLQFTAWALCSTHWGNSPRWATRSITPPSTSRLWVTAIS